MLESLGSDSNGVTLAQMLKRPEVQIEQLAPLLAKLMPDILRAGRTHQ